MAIIAITNSPSVARGLYPEVTVEAEYGLAVVEGTGATLAHHTGRWEGGPAPCQGPSLAEKLGDWDVVLVSHFDLDTLGGVARAVWPEEWDDGRRRGLGSEFWDLAATVDIRGPHRLAEIVASRRKETAGPPVSYGAIAGEGFIQPRSGGGVERAAEALQAFWAWSEAHRLFPPRDGSAANVSAFFAEAWRVASLLASGPAEGLDMAAWVAAVEERNRLLEAGEAWAAAKARLNAESFVAAHRVQGVVVRESDVFVNHLYTGLNGEPFRAVVALNTATGAITVSLADPIEGLNVADWLREQFGPEAGGHATIGGTPRNRRYGGIDLRRTGLRLARKLDEVE